MVIKFYRFLLQYAEAFLKNQAAHFLFQNKFLRKTKILLQPIIQPFEILNVFQKNDILEFFVLVYEKQGMNEKDY